MIRDVFFVRDASSKLNKYFDFFILAVTLLLMLTSFTKIYIDSNTASVLLNTSREFYSLLTDCRSFASGERALQLRDDHEVNENSELCKTKLRAFEKRYIKLRAKYVEHRQSHKYFYSTMGAGKIKLN